MCEAYKEGYYETYCKLKCRFPSYGLSCQKKATILGKTVTMEQDVYFLQKVNFESKSVGMFATSLRNPYFIILFLK